MMKIVRRFIYYLSTSILWTMRRYLFTEIRGMDGFYRFQRDDEKSKDNHLERQEDR